jgi:hypothetical protein
VEAKTKGEKYCVVEKRIAQGKEQGQSGEWGRELDRSETFKPSFEVQPHIIHNLRT